MTQFSWKMEIFIFRSVSSVVTASAEAGEDKSNKIAVIRTALKQIEVFGLKLFLWVVVLSRRD